MGTRGNGETRPAFMWNLPVCPHQVAVELDVIRTLQRALTAAAEPQQGLLFGRKTSGLTCVQAVQPLPALEPRVFTEALNQAWWPVAGFYRIREGRAFVLESGEIDCATNLFREPGSVVLLIERRETGPAEGAFAFWRGGHWFPTCRTRSRSMPPASAAMNSRRLPRPCRRRARPITTSVPAPFKSPLWWPPRCCW